jgi:hypothetical protein
MGLTSKRAKGLTEIQPMTDAELSALRDRLRAEVVASMTAIGDALQYDVGGDLKLLKAISQEGLTLAYRVNLLTGVTKILAGQADDLTRTERGLLGRNARIKPLLPDDDGGGEDD